ncbi:hypothetical protein [Succinivibrio sp.]|uniref:hypothetical protein n=1 Tax=Succinivibrio sp. TaxID=2053619 RepID=UPI00386710EB
MKRNLLIGLTLLSAVLCSCTTTKEQCDPKIKDPSFFDKLGCVVSGSYKERSDDKLNEIASLREEHKKLSQEVIALNDKRPQMLKDREKRLKELDKVRADLSRLENDLEAKKAMNSKLSSKLEAAKSAADEAYKLPDDSSSLEKKEKLKNVQDNMNELLDAMAESF